MSPRKVVGLVLVLAAVAVSLYGCLRSTAKPGDPSWPHRGLYDGHGK
jgi:hypothetical protein